MPEAFKNVYSVSSIENMAFHLERAANECATKHSKHTQGSTLPSQYSFNKQAFTEKATRNLQDLEMKQRADQIVEALVKFMPNDFEHCAKIFTLALADREDGGGMGLAGERQNTGIEGWLISPLGDYVGKYGLPHFELSMSLFIAFTKRFSSEFGIRYFLQHKPAQTLAFLHKCLADKNHHVRRLISEGTRPRLPWGMRLDNFIDDPEPVIRLIAQLKDDASEYVRRSVANNLNDIAKDHPERVSALAKEWLVDAPKDRTRLIKHACRTLFKQGHPATLAIFGFDSPKFINAKLSVSPARICIGDSVEIKFEVNAKASQSWMIDYKIYHQKANGSTSPKVFKGKQIDVNKDDTIRFSKVHSFKKVTTRTYYPGQHTVELVINGKSLGVQDFEVV